MCWPCGHEAGRRSHVLTPSEVMDKTTWPNRPAPWPLGIALRHFIVQPKAPKNLGCTRKTWQMDLPAPHAQEAAGEPGGGPGSKYGYGMPRGGWRRIAAQKFVNSFAPKTYSKIQSPHRNAQKCTEMRECYLPLDHVGQR